MQYRLLLAKYKIKYQLKTTFHRLQTKMFYISLLTYQLYAYAHSSGYIFVIRYSAMSFLLNLISNHAVKYM